MGSCWLMGLKVHNVWIKCWCSISVFTAVLHPLQEDPPIPSLVEIHWLNHYTQRLPSPNRWHISNATPEHSFWTHWIVWWDWMQPTIRCSVLCNLSETWTERFLSAMQSSFFAKQTADFNHHVPWSRHLLSCLRGILGADLLIGARAVVLNPHFQHFWSWEMFNLGQQYQPSY